jgi:hypothetical protein
MCKLQNIINGQVVVVIVVAAAAAVVVATVVAVVVIPHILLDEVSTIVHTADNTYIWSATFDVYKEKKTRFPIYLILLCHIT